ncbi:fatty acid desaturase-domain-containing protein [Zopfochytrium polystomum]|nr:fatty acid desaturase-domain-containing protein [Zopfochytrium polystomum]
MAASPTTPTPAADAAAAATAAAGSVPGLPPGMTVSTLRKSLPQHLFKKDIVRSHWYLFVDFFVIIALLNLYSPAMSWPIYALYANALGLFMWCLFVVGHDAGHGTFSDFFVVNAIAGHIAHGFLLVPFWPWAHSHALHHAYHQHIRKDKSHVWFVEGQKSIGTVIHDVPIFIPFLYGIGYLFLGIDDGSHYYPWSKLHTTRKDKIQCAFSAFVCYAFLGLFVYLWGSNVWGIYFGPWLVFNTWLYAVTYLQHHSHDTKVFGEGTWTFLNGALETVDRQYDTQSGVLDDVMHHITNGHVVHHMFSTSIPHYNLIEATKIIRPKLGDRYKLVKGFPLLELLQHHWYSTHPVLVWNGKKDIGPDGAASVKEEWVMMSQSELQKKRAQGEISAQE